MARCKTAAAEKYNIWTVFEPWDGDEQKKKRHCETATARRAGADRGEEGGTKWALLLRLASCGRHPSKTATFGRRTRPASGDRYAPDRGGSGACDGAGNTPNEEPAGKEKKYRRNTAEGRPGKRVDARVSIKARRVGSKSGTTLQATAMAVRLAGKFNQIRWNRATRHDP